MALGDYSGNSEIRCRNKRRAKANTEFLLRPLGTRLRGREENERANEKASEKASEETIEKANERNCEELRMAAAVIIGVNFSR